MSDVVYLNIKGDPRVLHVNRDYLVRESLYFKAMLSDNLAEQGKKTIELGLEGVVSFEILQMIIKYVTTLDSLPTKDTIEKLILAADFFQMDMFQDILAIQITTCVDLSNAIPLWQLAINRNIIPIRSSLEDYIRREFQLVSCDISFARLDVESVRTILEWDQLKVSSEKQILAAIKTWINSAYNDRIHHFTQLLHCVRLDYIITESFLKDSILNYCNCVGCTDFICQYVELQKNQQLVVGINVTPRLGKFDDGSESFGGAFDNGMDYNDEYADEYQEEAEEEDRRDYGRDDYVYGSDQYHYPSYY